MSKDFDTALSDALDSVARAARSAGPAAAQIRGRKRTMHKRIALSTVSLVLVAVGTTVAFKAANDGTSPHLVGANPSISVSSSPTTAAPTPSDSAPASSSPASTSPSASGSTTSSSQTATASQPAVADPHHAVDAAWLTPGQMPFANTFQWKALEATSQEVPIGQQLTPTVFYVPNNTGFQALTMCADPAQLLSRTIGAQHSEYTATTGTASSQFIFFFANAGSAQQTFKWLQTQYSSACLVHGSGVTVIKTGGDGVTSAAWLSVKQGSNGPVDMSPYNREFFVLRGSTIAYVSIFSTAHLPVAYDDSAQLSTIASHLCVYGGPCN